jgi:large subunit ribosomal protein L3
MTRVFDPETGVVTPCDGDRGEPCPVVQVKTADADGYDAVQIAYDKRRPDRKAHEGRARAT